MTPDHDTCEDELADPYNLDRVPGTAARMLTRYSTNKVAFEMAGDHANDFAVGSKQRIYWTAVMYEIRRHAKR